ncbi:hypothetical protein [Rhizobium oryzicola]|uniref:Lectin-like protein BA14k n=1 Tax=Rhizobium oryzicola TaxID=1232668 RepID=A0ABT8SUV5_9HYPH|nr:hypothetical protein [Rhizobium oryzicola]MDO1582224.1 hypothetical protein [Rhizobium oryzicola]
MSVLQKTVSAGLIAVSLGVALTATAPAAEAHDHFWAGVAAGTVGGLIGGAIASQPRAVYVEPEYRYVAPPPPPPVYHRVYYREVYEAPCHYEWRRDGWGDRYRVEVCPR